MTTNYVKLHQHFQARLGQLGGELPGTMTGFARLHKRSVEAGALGAKAKELMALAISIAVQCEGCVAYHTHNAIQSGATRPELLETIGVAIMMSGDQHPFILLMRWRQSINSAPSSYWRKVECTIECKIHKDR